MKPRFVCGRATMTVVSLCCGLGISAAQTVVYVDADALGNNDGSSWADAYTDLQSALVAIETGEIWVSAGVYRPAPASGNREATFQLRSGVALYGGFSGTELNRDERDPAANVTTLSGDLNSDDVPDFANNNENSYHVVTGSGTDATAVLDGFTITAGNADWNHYDDDDRFRGAGMFNDGGSPTLVRCIFSANLAYHGAGMYNRYGSPSLTACTFSANMTEDDSKGGCDGAGMHNLYSDPVLTDCTFKDNILTGRTCFGGGMYGNWSNPVLLNCLFEGNRGDCEHLNGGGGLSNGYGDIIAIDTEFCGNTVGGSEGVSGSGGMSGSGVFINCGFYGNGGQVGGGAGGGDRFVNCIFVGNSASDGGGVTTGGELINCTVANNSAYFGGGVVSYSGYEARVKNCVLWGNLAYGTDTVEEAQIYVLNDDDGTPDVNYSCIEGWSGEWGGISNIGDDPLFVDINGRDNVPGNTDDDLRLVPGSPCIDAGDNDSLPSDDHDLDQDGDFEETIPIDLDGNSRVVNDGSARDVGNPPDALAHVDMGAYEHQPDCNDNDILDSVDVLAGTSHDCNGNLAPDECELTVADCNASGLPDDCDIAAGSSLDCNENRTPDECETIDCNSNDVPDDCDLADGSSVDVDADGVPDECQCLADVNRDGRVDPLDVGRILAALGRTDPTSLDIFDVNHDGAIDPLDAGYAMSRMGLCP